MIRNIDIDAVARLIAEAAAEEIMPRFAKLAVGDVREKGPGDLVTIADEAVERRLAPQLIGLLPGSCVIGEEEAAVDVSVLQRLEEPAPVWIIDPVDGTANFAAGKGDFGVMVALVQAGRTVAGWIHDPVNKRMATAERGAGAWLDGKRLAVAPPPADPAELSGTLLVGFHGDPELGRRIQQRRERIRAVKSRRCAATEYLQLATGQMHFALFSRLMPWDHAPGVLIHAEAGGYNGYIDDGGGYEPARITAKGLLLAPDRASWQALYDRLIAP
jgi:fructose-1,6-bisphosphatase/inositol monophosphatase family enzyme